MIVVCRYSKRSGQIEWRRAMALKRINLTEFSIFFIDHGLYATVHYHMLRRLFKAFGQVPLQVHVIFNEIDVLFLPLNPNVTNDCRWIYTFCFSNCQITQFVAQTAQIQRQSNVLIWSD